MDVDAMLTELSPRQFNELRAAVEVIGIEDSWQQAGAICSTLYNTIIRAMASFGDGKVSDDAITKPEDFIPLLRAGEEKKSDGMMNPMELMQSLGALGHKVK